MRSLRLAVVVLLAVAWALTAGAGVAGAHAELVSTTPASETELDAAPEAIELRFTEDVNVPRGALRLLDARGAEVSVADVERLGGSRRDLRFAITEPLDDGVYVVVWRVVSADSHPISGTFTFTVGEAGTATAADALKAAGSAEGDLAVGVLFGIVRFVAFVAIVTLIGIGAVVMLLLPGAIASRRAQRWLIGAATVLGLASAAAIGLEGAYASGAGLSEAVDGELVRAALDTRFGRAMLPRIGVALAAIFVVRLLPGLPVLAGGVGAALLTFTALAGHATTGPWPTVAVLVDMVHLGAASVWLGGLVAMLAIVLPKAPDQRDALRRFSPIATVAIALVAVTGSVQSWRQVGSFEAFWREDFGRLLMLKVTLFIVILGLASQARRYVRRGAPDSETVPIPKATVRRIMAVEAAVGVAVLLVTALLVNAPPARTSEQAETAAPAGAFTGSAHTKNTQVDVRLSPAAVGPNTLEVNIGDHSGRVLDVPEVTASLKSLDDSSLGEIDVRLQRTEEGVWKGGATIPFRGRWELDVAVRSTDVDLDHARFTVIVV